MKRHLQEVIKAEDPAHPVISQYSYEEFHTSMVKMIYDIQDYLAIKPPYLMEVSMIQ